MFIFRFRRNKKKKSHIHNHNDDFDENNEPIKNFTKRLKQLKNFCKKIIAFLFSRVGLCLLVVLYVVLGGVIFQYIEGENEKLEKEDKKELKRSVQRTNDILIEEIWNMTKSELVFQEKNYTYKLKMILNNHKNRYIEALIKGYKENIEYETTKWTIPGSILYAVTLVTSIGYGHITCVTNTGKLVTIFYSIIGIPMMALCLANIGKSEANLCRFLYARVCCGYCNYVKRRNMRLRALARLGTSQMNQNKVLSYAALATTNLIMNSNGQSLFNAVQTNPNLVKDPAIFNKLTNNIKQSDEKAIATVELNNNNDKPEQQKQEFSSNNKNRQIEFNENNIKIDEADLFELLNEDKQIDYTKITVPISLTLFILSSYIILGGLLFRAIEKWSMLDGIYFCFITLSTIGLGDLVPGNSINESDTQAELKLIGCSLYLLIGLSLLMMGFNLMQEEIIAKMRRLGIVLGIINDPSYWQ